MTEVDRVPCKHDKNFENWFELANSERESLREHARQCASCSERLAVFVRVDALFDRGRQAYLDLRYRGPNPDWSRETETLNRSWTWLAGLMRPLPAFAAALLVLIAALAVWRSGFESETPVRQQVPLVAESESVAPAVSNPVSDEFASRREGEQNERGSFHFNKPSGPALTLTAARRAVNSERLGNALPKRPSRPSSLVPSFPKRPMLSKPPRVEVAEQEQAG